MEAVMRLSILLVLAAPAFAQVAEPPTLRELMNLPAVTRPEIGLLGTPGMAPGAIPSPMRFDLLPAKQCSIRLLNVLKQKAAETYTMRFAPKPAATARMSIKTP